MSTYSHPTEWAEVPAIEEADGWYPTDRGHAVDGLCRLDERFARPGSWAVRRLGGKELAAAICKAVAQAHPDTEGFIDGSMVVRGILFEYGFNRKRGLLTIRDAELVKPDPTHPKELTAFVADLWRKRANHASGVAQRLEASLHADAGS